MAPRLQTRQAIGSTSSVGSKVAHAAPPRLAFNVDAAAITLALTLAALIRLNVIHHIGW